MVEYNSNCSHITSDAVIDFVHYICCIFEMKTMKLFILPEIKFNSNVIQSHPQCCPSLDRLHEFLTETAKVVYTDTQLK